MILLYGQREITYILALKIDYFWKISLRSVYSHHAYWQLEMSYLLNHCILSFFPAKIIWKRSFISLLFSPKSIVFTLVVSGYIGLRFSSNETYFLYIKFIREKQGRATIITIFQEHRSYLSWAIQKQKVCKLSPLLQEPQ